MPKIKYYINLLVDSTLNSYSQIFFSQYRWFAVLLMLVSFMDYLAGLCGITAVIISNITAWVLGFDRNKISAGLYGFNSLLLGLGIGIYFEPSVLLFIILALSSVFVFFIAVVLEGVLGKYTLPYLSLPFLLVFWAVTIASGQFSALGISERGIYTLNDLYLLGGQNLVDLYNWWNGLAIVESLKVYFVSLGAIFFQYNVLSGIIIAIGILLYSRIAFSLSLIGFYSAYFFYMIIGARITETTYTYIGFNYILSAVAIGFFLIPSVRTYFWTIILVPVVAIITISASAIFSVFGLSIYSLPFNIIILVFLYVLKLRTIRTGKLTEVSVQQNSPEKNLYSFKISVVRFGKNFIYFPLRLPFWGEWSVAQGHDGKYTHKDDWKNAWDFVITDENNNQFSGEGTKVEDYYVYKKNVLAPADGFVNEIIDNIPDNVVGDVNLKNNWGNTIVIKHTEYLYSKLCHLKEGSFKVSRGDYVKQGQILALCGNSGRSPYPHLHFQLQATPFIGSKTLDYPISHYIEHEQENYKLKSFDIPKLSDRISNIQENSLLVRAFNFIPGKKIQYRVQCNGKDELVNWEVFTNAFNQSYIYCHTSKSVAYFVNDGTIHYFRHFEGNRKSFLYYFVLANYKLTLGFYQNLKMTDRIAANLVFSKGILFFHDFVAPFFEFLKSDFSIKFSNIDDNFNTTKITLESEVTCFNTGKITKQINCTSEIDTKGIRKLRIIVGKKIIDAVLVTETYE